MSNLPKPHYTIWQAIAAALELGMKALAEVRALAREPGPQGDPGDRGRDGLGFDNLELAFDGERTIAAKFCRGADVKEILIKMAIPLYRGVFQDGSYERGDMVTRDGSIWHCNAATKEPPGDGCKAWTLAAKRGRDGRDAKIIAEKQSQTIKLK